MSAPNPISAPAIPMTRFAAAQRCAKCASVLPEASVSVEQRRKEGGHTVKASCPHCGHAVKLNYDAGGNLRGGELLEKREARRLSSLTTLIHGDCIAD